MSASRIGVGLTPSRSARSCCSRRSPGRISPRAMAWRIRRWTLSLLVRYADEGTPLGSPRTEGLRLLEPGLDPRPAAILQTIRSCFYDVTSEAAPTEAVDRVLAVGAKC